MTDPAKLSPEFIREPEVHLEDLKPGETACVYWPEMAVDSQYGCYIDPRAVVRETALGVLRVTRTEAGFEVLIPANCNWRWKLGAYNPEADPLYARYLPVVKLAYGQAEDDKIQQAIARSLASADEIKREIAELEKKLKKFGDKDEESPGA
jgi:hypothetical protein